MEITVLVISADYTHYFKPVFSMVGEDPEQTAVEIVGDKYHQACNPTDLVCQGNGLFYIPISKLSPLPGERRLIGEWEPLNVG